MYIEAQRDGADWVLQLRGQWRTAVLTAVEAELVALDVNGTSAVRLDCSQASFDLSGAWLLRDYLQRLQARGLKASIAGAGPESLQLIERTLGDSAVHQALHHEHSDWLDPAAAVESLGRRTIKAGRSSLSSLAFIGSVSAALGSALTSLRRLRPTSIARHVYDTGITAIPVVSLIAFLISVILAYIGAQQLQQFGADIFVVDLVTIGLLRELAVLLTAIIVAGRSGSAFAAEIGAMKLNEEVDALRATGVNPIEVLVLPRILGLMIALPLLAVIADVVGLVGGGLLCRWLLDMPLTQYINRAEESIGTYTFWVGIWKAPVFAILIGMAGARCGMRVRSSSRELGRLTTLAVVQAIFFVILADAIFAVVFMELDI
jgi:phospholipid/cholesterol/gamma-HCH transport system permease protein